MREMTGLSVLLILFPTAASAEVMDKELSFTSMLLGAALVVGASVALARMKWWSSLVVLPFSGTYAVAVMLELSDPYVGPAIQAEGGLSYVLIAYGFSTAAVAVPIIVAFLARRTATRSL
jgi:membrane-bound metal-dependent hydrolase YbcI (DUF457 family)